MIIFSPSPTCVTFSKRFDHFTRFRRLNSISRIKFRNFKQKFLVSQKEKKEALIKSMDELKWWISSFIVISPWHLIAFLSSRIPMKKTSKSSLGKPSHLVGPTTAAAAVIHYENEYEGKTEWPESTKYSPLLYIWSLRTVTRFKDLNSNLVTLLTKAHPAPPPRIGDNKSAASARNTL